MPDYYELRPDAKQEQYGRDRKDIRLRLEPAAMDATIPNKPNIGFDDDLYDGFIDSRMYSCLNVRNQAASRKPEHNFYDRNVIVTPTAIRNEFSSSPSSSRPATSKIKRKRQKLIQQKVSYPPTDSDSSPSNTNVAYSNPFKQRVPVYLYEHYNKHNTFLPKASRRVYKCKTPKCEKRRRKASPREDIDKVDDASCPPRCEIVYMKEPHPSIAKTSLSAPTSDPHDMHEVDELPPAPEPDRQPEPEPLEAPLPEVRAEDICEEQHCGEIGDKPSAVQKQLKMYYEQQQLAAESKNCCNDQTCVENVEEELRAVPLNDSRGSRKSRRPNEDTPGKKTPPPESDSSRAPTHKPSEPRFAPYPGTCPACQKDSMRGRSRSKCCAKHSKKQSTSRSRKESAPRSRSKSSRSSHSGSKSRCTVCKSKHCKSRHMVHQSSETRRNNHLSFHTHPAVEVGPTDEEQATKGDGPYVAYQYRRPTQETGASSPGTGRSGRSSSYPSYPDYSRTASSPGDGYSSSRYYTGTPTGTSSRSPGTTETRTRTLTWSGTGPGTGSGTLTGTRTGTGTTSGAGYPNNGHTGYSGSDYYAGMKSTPVVRPGYVCDKTTCGFGSGPLEVGYATTIVSRFSKYTVYEILRPSMKRPPTMCRVTENVFVVKTKPRQR